MAKIMGVEFKNYKTYKGHEGESCIDASIYMDINGKSKKIGHVVEKTWSGEYEIEMADPQHYAEFEKRVAAYFAKHPGVYTTGSSFLYKLRELTDREKTFKKYAKSLEKYKGTPNIAPVLVYFLGGYGDQELACWKCPSEKHYTELIEEKKPKKHVVYRSLQDFIIE